MNRKMDEIVKGYPELVQKRDCLAYQLAHFRGFTADEIIESMYTPRQDGERVQTSNLSDKTAQIALDYQERRERINREWYEQMEKELQMVSDEVTFFEAAVHALPIKIRGAVSALFIGQNTWDTVQADFHIGRATLSAYRRQALRILENLYADRERSQTAFLLQ